MPVAQVRKKSVQIIADSSLGIRGQTAKCGRTHFRNLDGVHVAYKVNTLGLGPANKAMRLKAYNLRKFLKFVQKRSKSGAGRLALADFAKNALLKLFRDRQSHGKFDVGYPA